MDKQIKANLEKAIVGAKDKLEILKQAAAIICHKNDEHMDRLLAGVKIASSQVEWDITCMEGAIKRDNQQICPITKDMFGDDDYGFYLK